MAGKWKSCIVPAVAACLAGPLLAQTQPPPNSPLPSVPGLTELQQEAARVTQTVCGALAGRQNTLAGGERLLFDSCRKLVQTGNAINNHPTNTQFSLGLGADALGQALQGVVPEEDAAMTQRATVAKSTSPVGGRLIILRARARGTSVAEVTRDSDGQLALVERPLATGGGAAADLQSRFGGFVNLNYNTGDFDGTSLQPAFDFDTFGVTVGGDYRVNDNFAVGIGLTYDNNDTGYKAGLGDVDSKSTSITFYGSYTKGPWFVDGHLSFSRLDYDVRRNIRIASTTGVPGINTVAAGDTDGRQTAASIGGGYDFRVNNWNVTPYARLSYLRLRVDGFTESDPNGDLAAGMLLDIDSQRVTSLQSAVGVRFSTPVSTSYGVITPYAMLEWNHEFKGDSRSIVAAYAFDPTRTLFTIPVESPDRNFATITVGASGQFQRGISGFVNVDAIVGQSKVSNTGVTLGVRMEF